MVWLRFLLLVAVFAAVKGGTLKIRVDDEVKIYAGGKVVHNEFTVPRWQWGKLAEIPFDDNVKILAFQMYNQGPRRLGYGKGEIDGKDLFSSGIVCKDVPKKQDPDAFFPGWFEEDYDDFDWTPPKAVESHPTEGILADAQGFWGQQKASKNVLCRLKLNTDDCPELAPVSSCKDGFPQDDDSQTCKDTYECPECTSDCLHPCQNLGMGTCSCFDLFEYGKTCSAVHLEAKRCKFTMLNNSEMEVSQSHDYEDCDFHYSSRGLDNTSYTLSVDMYNFDHPYTDLDVLVYYNWLDSDNFDVIRMVIGYTFLTVWEIVDGKFGRESNSPDIDIPAGWFTLAIVVSPESDIPKVLLNGRNVMEKINTLGWKKRNPKIAAGGFQLYGDPLRFRNLRLA